VVGAVEQRQPGKEAWRRIDHRCRDRAHRGSVEASWVVAAGAGHGAILAACAAREAPPLRMNTLLPY
jgi:hypothetical protein